MNLALNLEMHHNVAIGQQDEHRSLYFCGKLMSSTSYYLPCHVFFSYILYMRNFLSMKRYAFCKLVMYIILGNESLYSHVE